MATIHPPKAFDSLIVPIGIAARRIAVIMIIVVVADFAFAVRNRAPYFFICALLLIWGGSAFIGQPQLIRQWRGFYGILREARAFQPRLGGEIHRLTNGSTLHGAEAVSPAFRCQPLLYYAHETPIGQVIDTEERSQSGLEVGVVGLGAGTMAAYDRPGDHFTFFEIDPLVLRVASDPRNFAYVSRCANGRLNFVIGDARLTLGHKTTGPFDVLLIDAFSSDSVPAHLLTVEAAQALPLADQSGRGHHPPSLQPQPRPDQSGHSRGARGRAVWRWFKPTTSTPACRRSGSLPRTR